MAATVTNTCLFLLFSIASFRHFKPTKNSFGNTAVRFLSLIGSFVLVFITISIEQKNPIASVLAIVISVTSGLIFIFAARATVSKNLGLVFAQNVSKELVTSGIYKHIRNPFYTAYLLYWLSWISATMFSVFAVLIFILFTIIYYFAVKKEEERLAEAFGDQYSRYLLNSGRFFPQLI